MKLKVIAKNEKGELINLRLEKENKTYVKGSLIEVDNKRGKELLKIKLNNYPIVELVKDNKQGSE